MLRLSDQMMNLVDARVKKLNTDELRKTVTDILQEAMEQSLDMKKVVKVWITRILFILPPSIVIYLIGNYAVQMIL